MINIIDERKLKKSLEGTMWKDIRVLEVTDSTNTYLKSCKSLCGGIAVFARRQTDGRGRRGRSWISDTEGNIYLSVSFFADFGVEKAPLTGFAAAVAVVQTVKDFFDIKCGIKWPNDIVADGRKLCGILCELTGNEETGFYAVCGIGINVKAAPSFLEIPAISINELCGDEYDITGFAAALLKNLEFEYNNIDSVIGRYRKSCLTVGREVKIISQSGEYTAVATEVEENGSLIVDRDGEKISINSGEVSVRGIYGYS